MASNTKSVLSPSLAARLSALRSVRRATDEETGVLLTEMATIPTELVVHAGQEIAKAAGLGWWRMPLPLQFVPAGTRFRRFLLKLGGQRQPQPLPSERDLLNRNPDYAWVFLYHPDGHLREASLHAINTLPPAPFFTSALAWRLNDWVPQVRQAAKRCLQRVAPQIQARVAADAAFYLLARRFVWRRWRDEASILDQIFERDDVLAALAAELEVRATGSLVACLRQAMRFPGFDRHLPGLAAGAAQPSVRAVAYQSLISGKVSWPVGFEWFWVDKIYNKRRIVPTLQARDIGRNGSLDDILAAAIHDRSAFVRKIVADAMITVRSQVADEAPLVAKLAADRSAAVRSRADFMLRHPAQRPAI
jgi:hypothetical protein